MHKPASADDRTRVQRPGPSMASLSVSAPSNYQITNYPITRSGGLACQSAAEQSHSKVAAVRNEAAPDTRAQARKAAPALRRSPASSGEGRVASGYPGYPGSFCNLPSEISNRSC
jgi:hypothetical protein